MTDDAWLEKDETILGQWSVSTNGYKSYGKIYLTNKYFRYNQQGSFREGEEIHVEDQKFLAIPYDQIRKAEIVKKFFIFKNLRLCLDSGDDLVFRFGVMSPQKALDTILNHSN